MKKQTFLTAFGLILALLLFAQCASSPHSPVSGAMNTSDITLENKEIPLDILESFKWIEYRFQRGDSIASIARQFNISADAILACNNNLERVQAEQTLRIPNIDGIGYMVKSGDTMSKIAVKFKVPLEIILDANDTKVEPIEEGEMLFIPGVALYDVSSSLRTTDANGFIYPVNNPHIISSFGWRRDPIFNTQYEFHSGIDFSGEIGTPVFAAMDGIIIDMGNSQKYGKYIILEHDNNFQTLYAHLSVISVKQGVSVIQGNKIGEIGDTGFTTVPHLHFGVFRDGKAVVFFAFEKN